MEFLKNLGRKILWVLDELTYFLPDVFLVLGVISCFTNVPLIVTVMLFITYLGTSYGEYQYFKNKAIRQSVGEILDQLKAINESDKQFVTFDGLLIVAEVIEDTIDEKINDLRNEIKGVANSEVDSEDSEKEVQGY
jgi:hypothetical protein